MLGVSLLVHVAVIYLIPGGEIFPPAQQQEYIELETFPFEAEEQSAVSLQKTPESPNPAQALNLADEGIPLQTRPEPADPLNVLDRNEIKNEGTFLLDNSSVRLPERLASPGHQQRPASLPSPQTPAVRDGNLAIPQSPHRPEPSSSVAKKQELAVSDITAAAVKTRESEPEPLPLREAPEIDRIPAARPPERLTSSATQGSEILPEPNHMARLASPVESFVQPDRIPQPFSPAITIPSLRLPETKGTPETVQEEIATTAEELPDFPAPVQPPDTLVTPEEIAALPVAERNTLPTFPKQPRLFSSALTSQAKRQLPPPSESSTSSVTFSHQENQKVLVHPEVKRDTTAPVSETQPHVAAITPLTRIKSPEQTSQREADLRHIPEIKEKSSPDVFNPTLVVSKPKPLRVSPSASSEPSLPATLSPPVSRVKVASPLNLSFALKSVAYAEEPAFQPLQPSQRRSMVVTEETAQEDLQQPRAIGLREKQPRNPSSGLTQPLAIQRSFPVQETTSNSLFRQPRSSSFGLFVRKQESLPELTEPQKLTSKEETIQRAELQKSTEESPVIVIEGPAARRDVIYKPRQLPEVSIDREVDLRLKFWVLPDGSIGEVIPLQRGDIRLERVAIEYLKNWRFTPVSPSSPKVWGIMPITYKLR